MSQAKTDREGRERVIAVSVANTLIVSALLRFLVRSGRMTREELGCVFGGATALLDRQADRLPPSIREAVFAALLEYGRDLDLSPGRH